MKLINLSKLAQVPLREAWQHEAGDFTPWLAQPDNLNLLSDALGIGELELIATEHPVGKYKLDILATDGNQQVIIENQLEYTDHDHLGKILAYAAGVDARVIVWVAKSFQQEHAAALQFLNEHTSDEISFFGVQIELWRIGDSPAAPKFEIIVKPNNWTRTSREGARAVTAGSPLASLRLKFWTSFIERIKTDAPSIRPHSASTKYWLTTSVGRTDFSLNFIAKSRESVIGIELYIKRSNAKNLFSSLIARKHEIESQLGFRLDWQELPEKEACRIAVWSSDSNIEDEGRWPEYQTWLIKHFVLMDTVFRPIIKDLP
jgi:hypothetical protein